MALGDTLPLMGYRPFAADLLGPTVRRRKLASFKIPGAVFIQSAQAMPHVVKEITSARVSNPVLSDWYLASKAAIGAFEEPRLTYAMGRWNPTELKIDPTFALELPKTEICDATRLVGDGVELVNVDWDSLAKFTKLYGDLEDAGIDFEYRGLMTNFSRVRELMASGMPLLQSRAEVYLGEVTFGEPSLFSARKRKLDLPDNFADSHEGFWVDFPVTFGDMDYRRIKTLLFEVTATQGVNALALAPARQGIETTVQTTLSTPEIAAEVSGTKLSLGEWYKREVTSKWSKPTIITEGLGENDFCWRMTGEAVERGSKTFGALLAIPKHKRRVILKTKAGAQTKEGWIQGSFVSTTDKQVTLKLP